jgi:2-isopropylmalate synthase
VHYGTANIPTATVSAYQPNGELVTEAATGAGSVEAIFNTLERIVAGEVHILDYRVTSIGKGRDALGEAVINMTYDGETVTGRDVAQDVLEATAKAYLNTVNRQLVKAGQKVKVAVV